jgi:PAS domain S-box-containing protein
MWQDDQSPTSLIITLTITSVIIVVIILLLLIGLTIQPFLSIWQWEHIPLQVSLQIIGAFMALCTTLYLLILRELNAIEASQIWIGYILLGMGLLDGLQAFRIEGENFIIIQTMTTCIIGVLFAFVWLPTPILTRLCQDNRFLIGILSSSILIAVFTLTFPTHSDSLEKLEEHQLVALQLLNTLGTLGFFFAAWYFFRSSSPTFLHFLFANHCLLLALASGLLQLAHFTAIWDATWGFWYILRLTAFGILLYYIINMINQSINQLVSNEQRLHLIMELAPVGIFYVDMNNKNTSINQQGLAITGLQPEEVKEKGWLKTVHPQDRKYVLNLWQQTIGNNQVFKSQHRIKHSNGSTIWVSVQAVAERDITDSIVGYVGTLIDISEAKQNEKELNNYRVRLEEIVEKRTHQMEIANESLQQEIIQCRQNDNALRDRYAPFTQLMESLSPVIIVTTDAQKIILFNKSAEQLWGYLASEVIGKPLSQIITTEIQADFQHLYAKWLIDSSVTMVQPNDLKGKDKKGEQFYLEGTITKWTLSSQTLLVLSLGRAKK